MITVAAVWLLGVLNDRDMPEKPAPQHIRSILLRGADYESILPNAEPEPVVQPETEPERMPIETAPRPSTNEPVAPLELAIRLPPPAIESVKINMVPPKPARTVVPPVFQAVRRPSSDSTARPPAARPESPPASIVSGKIDEPPQELSGNTEPEYPDREDRLGIEGSVLIHILIEETGRVADVRVIRGLEAFRKPVIKAALSWRFTRPRHQGQAVKVWRAKVVNFRKG